MEPLSGKELEFLSNKEHFKLKTEVSQKLLNSLNDLGMNLIQFCTKENFALPNGIKQDWKVSKGENHNGFPYLVLDCPKLFKNMDIFTFRTLIWMGNSFSFHLHIHGQYLEERKPVMFAKGLSSDTFTTYINFTNVWDYTEQYTDLEINSYPSEVIKENIKKSDKIRLSSYFPLERLNEVAELSKNRLRFYMSII